MVEESQIARQHEEIVAQTIDEAQEFRLCLCVLQNGFCCLQTDDVALKASGGSSADMCTNHLLIPRRQDKTALGRHFALHIVNPALNLRYSVGIYPQTGRKAQSGSYIEEFMLQP